jgi:thiosulfate dehydrogenase
MKEAIRSHLFVVVLFLIIGIVVAVELINTHERNDAMAGLPEPADSTWVSPSLYTDHVTTGKERDMIIYGKDLIANTSKYLGPHGSVLQISNGMNCQNCHLDAGTRPWGNNYSAVFSTYPKFRARSGSIENIYKRVNDCFERSLNSKALDTNSYEMQSIYAYMKWLGQDVPKGKKPYSVGLPTLTYLNRAADLKKGKAVYSNNCQSCHSSYNDGAGLYRITKFSSFVNSNMPFNQATHDKPLLTDEEAWDVAAYVNSQPRPHKDQSGDWADISQKAIDEPFGPYADGFSEVQHKYGPYKPIEEARKGLKQNKKTIH